MVKRVVTGAHYGLRDWLVQRITAVVMALYSLFIVAWILLHSMSYDAWTGLFASDIVRSFSLLFWLSLFWHGWVGVRDIVMDYVRSAAQRLVIHVIVVLTLALYAIWSVQILWGM